MRPASLPMYDADPVAVGAWWHAIADALRAESVAGVPDAIAWPDDLDAHWRDPSLLLSQTCGYPFVTRLSDVVQVVGAFRYTAPGASGIQYRSALLAREGDAGLELADFRGRRVALNALDSYSGWHALRASLAALDGIGGDGRRDGDGDGRSHAHDDSPPPRDDGGFFRDRLVTGSHRASLIAVQASNADLAAIDCITLAGLRRHAPHLLAGLSIIGHTDPAPGLPLVTARRTSAEDLAALRRALDAVSHDPLLADVRDALFIGGFVAAPSSAWDRIRDSCAPLEPDQS
jgi:ABC-type phosphate/phosphonate transport system substrate-binding protein